MIIPLNSIVPDQYTLGGEFILNSTGEPYQGFYCIIQGNKFYTGKTYTELSKKIVKVNSLENTTKNDAGIPPTKNIEIIRYFIKKVNVFPILIREVDKNTFDNFINNSFYITLSIPGSQVYSGSIILDEADRKMTGLKIFLSNELNFTPPEG